MAEGFGDLSDLLQEDEEDNGFNTVPSGTRGQDASHCSAHGGGRSVRDGSVPHDARRSGDGRMTGRDDGGRTATTRNRTAREGTDGVVTGRARVGMPAHGDGGTARDVRGTDGQAGGRTAGGEGARGRDAGTGTLHGRDRGAYTNDGTRALPDRGNGDGRTGPDTGEGRRTAMPVRTPLHPFHGSVPGHAHTGDDGHDAGRGHDVRADGSGDAAPAVTLRHGARASGTHHGTHADGAPAKGRGHADGGDAARRRGPDRRPRVRRDHIGALTLDDGQERIMDRVNRERTPGAAFVPTERDGRIWDYLALFRFATRRDVARVAGWRGGYAMQSPRIARYGELGLTVAERIPFSGLDYVMLTHEGMAMSSYPFLPDPAPTEAVRGDRSHSLGLSSLASQLLAPDPGYDGPGHDLLGLGDDGWAALRSEVAAGDAKVIGETIYRSAWSSMRSRAHKAGRPLTALTDPGIAGSMADIFRRWKASRIDDDTVEWECCDPEYHGEYAWLWMIYGGEAVRGDERDAHGRPRHVPASERATDERGRIIEQPGDTLVTRDHPPDMVIARHRDRRTGRPRSIAVELELTGKSTDDYRATMSAYMSDNGRILYDRVVWLVIQGSVANMIRAGAQWAGAVEGRDYSIVPVTNDRGRTREAFYDGMDMRPGRFDVRPGGGAYGFAVADAAIRGMGTEGSE